MISKSLSLVRSTISGRHQIEQDLVTLYRRLVDLGMEHRGGQIYLADLGELEGEDVQV